MDDKNLTSSIEVHPQTHSEVEKDPAFFKPDVSLMILTWVAFAVLLVILKKFAWGPILEGLEKREADIRKSVSDADRIRQEMEHLAETKRQVLIEARQQSEALIEESRHAAREAGKGIEKQAKDQAQIIFENAQREARDAANQAYANLKKQSADMIVDLTSKLVRENMTNDKNKKIVEELIKGI